MSEFTMNTPAGPFHVDEVYIEYDGPRLFACHDENGIKYIGTWVDEAPSANTWVFTPVTPQDAEAFQRSELALRTLMLRPLGGSSLMVRLSVDPSLQYSRQVVPDDIPLDYLPDEGECLPRPEGEPLLLESTVLEYASATDREALDVYLQPIDNCLGNRIEASKLGGILSALQPLARALARRGRQRIPLRTPRYDPGRLLVAGFMAGSFGVRLEACGEMGLFGDTAAAGAMEDMLQLLSAVQDVEELSRILADNRQAGPPARQLLETIAKGNLEFRAEWGSPSGRSGSVKFSPIQSKAALAAVDFSGRSEVDAFAIHGRLVGLMADTRSFRLLADSGRRYLGTYADGLMDSDIGNVRLSEIVEGIPCTATLIEDPVPAPLGKTKRPRYVLLDIMLD